MIAEWRFANFALIGYNLIDQELANPHPFDSKKL